MRHVNGDPLDCRRANLIVRTVQQRVRNARKRRATNGRPPSSRFKGVFWESWTKKWRACIVVDGRKRSLGRYGDEIAAALAYDEAARKWFGEHARLNFPDGVDAWLEREWPAKQAAEAAAAEAVAPAAAA
ncbi:MAG TPA: AP2 domain-containing protein [Tepidisphaeraceae bacterium]|nr:AP2 domain-containing protein [Tepidisphaeraceae bacterium]